MKLGDDRHRLSVAPLGKGKGNIEADDSRTRGCQVLVAPMFPCRDCLPEDHDAVFPAAW